MLQARGKWGRGNAETRFGAPASGKPRFHWRKRRKLEPRGDNDLSPSPLLPRLPLSEALDVRYSSMGRAKWSESPILRLW